MRGSPRSRVHLAPLRVLLQRQLCPPPVSLRRPRLQPSPYVCRERVGHPQAGAKVLGDARRHRGRRHAAQGGHSALQRRCRKAAERNVSSLERAMKKLLRAAAGSSPLMHLYVGIPKWDQVGVLACCNL
jgi:hypothetical protein